MIQRYDNSIPLRDLVFYQVSIWVQVHDIPVRYLNREVAKDLCEAMGVVNRDSIITDVDRGCVMRIRVWVNVSLPLCRGRIFRWRMALRVGFLSNTSTYQIFVIGVVA